ncbi:MAG TPA: TolC family protein, partial [Anaeromyxobacteraceae bacterium]|nr:TolC family protein [Anaeromyxobacteraceae bacterium]
MAPGRFVADRVPPADPGPAPAPVVERAAPAAAEPSPAPLPPAPRSLDDLLERALAQDPEARAAWHDARAAAAAAGSRRASWYPRLDASADVGRSGGDAGAQTSGGVAASLSWLLLDFTRGSSIEQADQQLLAARLARRAAVLDLVLQVQETYYQYLGARALAAAQQSAVKQAETSLAAAEDRRRAGVATIADVLQARTALSQAQLALQDAEGQALTLRGALATLAGLPPTAPLEVGELPERVAREAAEPEIERLLDEAAARNPDLARARALADAADANARAVARGGLPTVGFDAGAQRNWPIRPEGDAQTTWTFGLTLRLPIFEGFGRT